MYLSIEILQNPPATNWHHCSKDSQYLQGFICLWCLSINSIEESLYKSNKLRFTIDQLFSTLCLVAAMQAYPCYLSTRKPRPTDHRNDGWFGWDSPYGKKNGRTWDVGKNVKISRVWSFCPKNGKFNVDFFGSTWDVHWEGLKRRLSGHMLCDAWCMQVLDDNEKCKRYQTVMMVDGFPVCFSCYPNCIVSSWQPVQNQKNSDFSWPKRFQLMEKHYPSSISFPQSPAGKSPHRLPQWRLSQCNAWRSLAGTRSTLPTTPHFRPLGGRLRKFTHAWRNGSCCRSLPLKSVAFCLACLGEVKLLQLSKNGKKLGSGVEELLGFVVGFPLSYHNHIV